MIASIDPSSATACGRRCGRQVFLGSQPTAAVAHGVLAAGPQNSATCPNSIPPRKSGRPGRRGAGSHRPLVSYSFFAFWNWVRSI